MEARKHRLLCRHHHLFSSSSNLRADERTKITPEAVSNILYACLMHVLQSEMRSSYVNIKGFTVKQPYEVVAFRNEGWKSLCM